MKRRASRITITGCQIKSLEIAVAVANALDTIEKVAGIHSVRIEIDQTFVCPDIDLKQLDKTPMERVLAKVLRQQLDYNLKSKKQK